MFFFRLSTAHTCINFSISFFVLYSEKNQSFTILQKMEIWDMIEVSCGSLSHLLGLLVNLQNNLQVVYTKQILYLQL